MTLTRICGVFILLTVLSCIPKECTEIMSKTVCFEDSVQLFQNVSLRKGTIEVNHIFRNLKRTIALWSSTYSEINYHFDGRVFLDAYTIWIKNVQQSDEGKYILIYSDDFKTRNGFEVELTVYVPPNMHCKPNIKSMNNHLFALLDVNVCGKPPASAYWLGYSDQDVINVQPGNEAGPYHACIQGPALKCVKSFMTRNFCSSFKRLSDEKLQPKIAVERINIQDHSITLQCRSNGETTGRFIWTRNGISINNSAKYFQVDNFLIVQHLRNDDKYDIYTCMQSGSRFESDPFSIATSGPSIIQVNSSSTVLKDMDAVNVSCLTDCYPLCSVTWIMPDLFARRKNELFVENDVLQIRNVTRHMSGNYTCKVQNLITETFIESSFSLNIHYGPEKIFLNTSNISLEVDEFDSISILCTAECFPSCFVIWTEENENKQIGYSELNLTNVSSNGSYTCHAWNPNIDTHNLSKTIHITVKFDTNLIPNIEVFTSNVSDSSVVLQCDSFRKTQGMFSWMINGSLVKHSDKYSPDNDFLYVRHLTAEDLKTEYTCKEPGSNIQSKQFWIKAYGPISIKFSPNEVVVKEHDVLNVSCLADCYDICSIIWSKLDTQYGQKDVYSEGNLLQIMDIRREMSGSYSCKIQNILSGEVKESHLPLEVLYGPDEIVLNTTSNVTEVDEFDSVTIVCTAKCFPPCLISWIENTSKAIMQREPDLKLVNVRTDGIYTCNATNPKIANTTILETIIIKVKYDAKLIPRIVIAKYKASDNSIVLQCISSRTQSGLFTWRVNGSMIIDGGKYSEYNQFLAVKQLSDDDKYNSFTCTEPGSGFQSDHFSTKTYGPHGVVLTTTENKTNVHAFTSTTLLCSADCFPPCLFRWTFSYTDTVIEGANLVLGNVTSNGIVTCHARNPIHLNATLSKSIDIMETFENDRQKTGVDQDRKSTIIDSSTNRYLLQIVPVIGAFAVIIAFILCLRKKYIPSSCIVQVSNNNAHSDFRESDKEESLSQQYWTIEMNARGQLCTVFESETNVELTQILEHSASNNTWPEERESQFNSFNTAPIATETLSSHSIEIEGYINPIHSDPTQFNDNNNLSLSHPIECNEYIHPISSHSVDCNELIHPIQDTEYIHPIASQSKEGTGYIHPIPSDPCQLDGYIDPSPPIFNTGSGSINNTIPLYPGEYHASSEEEENDRSSFYLNSSD